MILSGSHGKNSISARFRGANIILFLLASALIISATLFILKSITDTVSKDYARLYSVNTSGALSAYLGRDLSLMKKAASSEAVAEWFSDESNERKKAAALAEMFEVIDVLSSDNVFFAIEQSLNEYAAEQGDAAADIVSHSKLMPGYFDDAWYFECRDSENPYTLNVDIDKFLSRKLVWINYKVVRDGAVLGVVSSGLNFADKAEALLGEYDNTRVRGVIIDENGAVQMDSERLGEEDFLLYGRSYSIDDEFHEPALSAALGEYLAGIDGVFDSQEPVVARLSGRPYSYATIAPIALTNWSVVTLYNASSLFNTTRLLPLFAAMLAMLIGYAAVTGSMSYRLLFRPIELLISSLAMLGKNRDAQIYGTGREDEIGELSRTVQSMKDRLDSYSADLEKEVEARSSDLRLAYRQTREKNDIILAGIDYASRIQRNLLPSRDIFEKAFSDYSVLWSPRDVVGGDIYWIKTFEKGTLLCVCDCTGHGTSGALLTMLVVSSLETIANADNCCDTARIITLLDHRLSRILNSKSCPHAVRGGSDILDGCDIAAVFVSKNGEVSFSSGNTHVIVCDGSGVTRIRGQRLRVGEGAIGCAGNVKVTVIPASPDNKFYIASDGLFDQIGGARERPFGYREIERIILESHRETQAKISGRIWEAFEAYRGDQDRRDDAQLITFKP